MKRQILAMATTIVFLMISWFPCRGEENQVSPNFKLDQYKFNAPAIGSSSKYSNLITNSAGQEAYPNDSTVTIYVSVKTGNDSLDSGLSANDPFKTIGYALSRIPFLRPSPDFLAIIDIAQGRYKESITIKYDKVYLVGKGNNKTKIIGTSGEETIRVNNSADIAIVNLSVEEG